MSRLRQSFLVQLRILGNKSGCHQLPERSFFYKGKQFPVCARCTGVALGQVCAIIYSIFYQLPIMSALIMLFSMGLDWFLQAIHILKSTNPRRLVTGFLGGFGLFSVYIFIIKKIYKWIKARKNRS